MTEDTPWLTNSELLYWLHLSGLMMTVPPAIDAQLKRDSLLNYFEYSILVALSGQQSRSMQMAGLAIMANGSQSRLSHAVSRLEKAGWVQRRATGESRCVEAVLTEAGLAKLVEAAPGHVREVRRTVVDVLTPEELDVMTRACRKILRATVPQGLAPIDDAIARVEGRPPEHDDSSRECAGHPTGGHPAAATGAGAEAGVS